MQHAFCADSSHPGTGRDILLMQRAYFTNCSDSGTGSDHASECRHRPHVDDVSSGISQKETVVQSYIMNHISVSKFRARIVATDAQRVKVRVGSGLWVIGPRGPGLGTAGVMG
jgi:hypothetical protein